MSDLGCWLARVLALLAALAGACSAQSLDPVKWSLSVEPAAAAPGSKVLAHLTATIEPGWHLYSYPHPPLPFRPGVKLGTTPSSIDSWSTTRSPNEPLAQTS